MFISPRPSGQVLADAVGGLGRTWKTLMLPAISVSMLTGALSVVVFRTSGAARFLRLAFDDPQALQALPSEAFDELSRPFFVAGSVVLGVQLLSTLLIALMGHLAATSDLAGRKQTSRQILAGACRRYPVALVAMLLVLTGLSVLFGSGAVLWSVPATIVGTPNATSTVLATILFSLLLGPGVWATVAASMTTSVVAVETGGPLNAIRRSMGLVRHRWWATAAFLVVVGLLGGVAIQLIQLVALPLAAVGVGGTTLAAAALVGTATQGLLVVAIAAVYTHWYVDLRARQEGVSAVDLGG